VKTFFETVRAAFGPLRQAQIAGITALLDATRRLPLRHRAYVLATAWHETGPASSKLHMTPRKEIWGPTPAQKRYEGHKGLGNTVPGDGKRFMGRGYVQITGRANYQKASNLVGKDLAANPDLALDPAIAALIIVDGMKNGWFTGKKMSDFPDYEGMRRVVNGTDKAALIAGYARNFELALQREADTAAPLPAPVPPPPMPVPEPAAPKPPGQSIARAVIIALGAIIAAAAAWIIGGK
jgi:putative chitinase